MDMKEKEKKIRVQNKARAVREIHIQTGIAEHDLKTKLVKIKEFLIALHPVKVSIMVKKVKRGDPAVTNPSAHLDQIMLRILEDVESLVSTTRKQDDPNNPSKVDFTLFPLKKTD